MESAGGAKTRQVCTSVNCARDSVLYRALTNYPLFDGYLLPRQKQMIDRHRARDSTGALPLLHCHNALSTSSELGDGICLYRERYSLTLTNQCQSSNLPGIIRSTRGQESCHPSPSPIFSST